MESFVCDRLQIPFLAQIPVINGNVTERNFQFFRNIDESMQEEPELSAIADMSLSDSGHLARVCDVLIVVARAIIENRKMSEVAVEMLQRWAKDYEYENHVCTEFDFFLQWIECNQIEIPTLEFAPDGSWKKLAGAICSSFTRNFRDGDSDNRLPGMPCTAKKGDVSECGKFVCVFSDETNPSLRAWVGCTFASWWQPINITE